MTTLRDDMAGPLGQPEGSPLRDLDRAIGDLSGREFLDAGCGPFLITLPPGAFPWEDAPGAKPSLAKRIEALQADVVRLAKLRVHALGAAILAQDLDPASGLEVGRPRSGAPIQLEDGSISKRHARLTLGEDGAWELLDLSSTNGTQVEGRKVASITAAPIRSGMRLAFGTRDALFLDAKHLYVLLRKTEFDLEAPVGRVAGMLIPAEGIRLRKLAAKVAQLPAAKFLAQCSDWFLLEVPTDGQEGTVAPGSVRGRTVSLDRDQILGATRSKKVSSAQIHVIASRHADKDCVLVGRDARRCDLVIDHPSVSGIHAELRWTGDSWSVQDCESENGTFVQEQRLATGDSSFLHARQGIWFGGYQTILLSPLELHGFALRLVGPST